MDTADMQQVLAQSLANDRVVDVDDEKVSIARIMTNVVLEVSDQSFEPRAIVARNVWFMVAHGSERLDKKMLVLLADTSAEDNRGLAPITAGDLLRTKLALAFAFDHAFSGRSADLRQDESHRGPAFTPR